MTKPLPHIGARVEILAKGFDSPRIGICVRIENAHTAVLDMDRNDLLPENFKYERISIHDDFKIL